MAVLEIQIEGKYGWAEKLPTRRPDSSKWYSKIYKLIMCGKDLTGYHLSVLTLVLIFFHYPYFTVQAWDWSLELKTLSFFFLVSIVWDFLWFVLNPHYGLRRFKPEYIWWHKKWFLFMPIDYYLALIISALFYLRFSLSWILFQEWLFIVALFLLLTLIVIIFRTIFSKIASP